MWFRGGESLPITTPCFTQPLAVLTRWHVGPRAVHRHVGGHEPWLRGWLIWGGRKFRRGDGNPLGLSHHGGDGGDAI